MWICSIVALFKPSKTTKNISLFIYKRKGNFLSRSCALFWWYFEASISLAVWAQTFWIIFQRLLKVFRLISYLPVGPIWNFNTLYAILSLSHIISPMATLRREGKILPFSSSRDFIFKGMSSQSRWNYKMFTSSSQMLKFHIWSWVTRNSFLPTCPEEQGPTNGNIWSFWLGTHVQPIC